MGNFATFSFAGFPDSSFACIRPLSIGHDAWIGANTIITPGCANIGIGAVVGAGSVVTKSIPDFAVVAGNPAKLIRFRFRDKLQQEIISSEWWRNSKQDCLNSIERYSVPAESLEFPEKFASSGPSTR